MQTLFTLATNETATGSVFYLNQIFGNVGTVLTGTGPGILGAMFKVFNTTVLTLGSLIVTYTTFVSIILTAHEGEALGKKFHSLWIPVRTVMGVASLIPTAGGYSTLQIALMWFIIQGVGAADTLWQSTINYIAAGGSTAGTASSPSGTAILQQNFNTVFEYLLCQASAKAKYGAGAGTGYFCTDNPGDPFCKNSDSDMLNPANGPQVNSGVYTMGPMTAQCGTITINSSTDSTPGLVAAKQAAFASVIPTLGVAAAQLIAADNAYSTWYNTAGATAPSWVTQYCSTNNVVAAQCISPKSCLDPSNCNSAFTSFPPPQPNADQTTITQLYWPYALEPTAGQNFIALAATVFSSMVNTAMQQNTQATPTLLSWQQNAVDNGWIFAGAYYYSIAQINNTTTNYADITHNINGPSSSTTYSESVMKTWTGQNAQALITAISKSAGSAPSVSSSTTIPGLSIFGTPSLSFSGCGGLLIGDAICGSIMQEWVGGLSGAGLNKNPIVSAQNFGNDILNAIQWAVLALFVFNVAMGVAGMIVTFGEGFFTAEALVMTFTVVPFAIFLMTIFAGIGVTLAVYIPMIPYMLFTFGALNWMIACIETMIAAPIIAVGLLHPEGGENLWGKAEAALNLLINIFLRPSLMIFGMVSAMLLSAAVITMINVAFFNVVNMISGDLNIIEAIMFLVLYTSFFTTAMNKCFDLIHIVPDKILRWMGGGQETFGESGGVAEIGKAVDSAGGQVGGSVKGAEESYRGGRAKLAEYKRGQKKDEGGTPPAKPTGEGEEKKPGG